MQKTMLLLMPNGKVASDTPVAVFRLSSLLAGPDEWKTAVKVDSGSTNAQGKWVYNDGNLPPNAIVALVVYSKKEDVVVFRSDPVLLRVIPDPFTFQIPKDPSLPADEVDDTQVDDRPGAKSRYATYLRRRQFADWNFRAQTHRAIANNVGESLRIRNESRKFIREVLHRKPRIGRTESNFVPIGEDSTEKENNARQLGIDRLARQSDQQRGVVVRRAMPLIKDLSRKQEIDAAELSKLLARLRDTRKQAPFEHLLQQSRNQAELAALGCGQQPDSAIADLDHPSEPASTDSPIGGRPTVDDVSRNLEQNIPSGPADATAYYHVKALQVAWSNIWTGVVDRQLEEKVIELYAALTEEMSYVGAAEALAKELQEKEELEEIVDTLEQLAEAISVELVAPTEIIGWLPEVANQWSTLSALEQDEIMFLYRAHTIVEGAYKNRYQPVSPPESA